MTDHHDLPTDKEVVKKALQNIVGVIVKTGDKYLSGPMQSLGWFVSGVVVFVVVLIMLKGGGNSPAGDPHITDEFDLIVAESKIAAIEQDLVATLASAKGKVVRLDDLIARLAGVKLMVQELRLEHQKKKLEEKLERALPRLPWTGPEEENKEGQKEAEGKRNGE